MFGFLALVCWSRPVRSPGPAFPLSLRCSGPCLGPTLDFGGDLRPPRQRGVKCVSLVFFVNFSEESGERKKKENRARLSPQTDPGAARVLLRFHRKSATSFFQKRELASRVVGGAAQQRNTTEHDRSCCSLFVVKLLRRLIHKHRWPTTLQDLLSWDFRI